MKMNLDELRVQIDSIDDEIATLLGARLELVRKVGELKAKDGSAVYRPEREKAIISRLSKKLEGFGVDAKGVEAIYSEIFSISRALEGTEKIAFLGPIGTYSYEAAVARFGQNASFEPVNTIEAVFKEVSLGRAKFGVVPIENNTQGAVGASFDALKKYENIKIIGEIYIDINHCLASVCADFKGIERVYSHEQAYYQCKEFLIAHGLDKAQFIKANSTAQGAALAKNDEKSAVICSKISAKINALPIIAQNIEDICGNKTRFFVIALFDVKPSNDDKTSILAITPDEPGALFNLLGAFKEQGINITHLESRPVKSGDFKSLFYLDFIGHKDDERVKKALEKNKNQGLEIRVLGSYPQSQ